MLPNMAASIATAININLCKYHFTLLCVMVSPWTSPIVDQAHDDRVRRTCMVRVTALISRSVCAIRRLCLRTAWHRWKRSFTFVHHFSFCYFSIFIFRLHYYGKMGIEIWSSTYFIYHVWFVYIFFQSKRMKSMCEPRSSRERSLTCWAASIDAASRSLSSSRHIITTLAVSAGSASMALTSWLNCWGQSPMLCR